MLFNKRKVIKPWSSGFLFSLYLNKIKSGNDCKWLHLYTVALLSGVLSSLPLIHKHTQMAQQLWAIWGLMSCSRMHPCVNDLLIIVNMKMHQLSVLPASRESLLWRHDDCGGHWLSASISSVVVVAGILVARAYWQFGWWLCPKKKKIKKKFRA